jgi:hypothetical protein
MIHASRDTKKQNFIRGWFQNEDAAGGCVTALPDNDNCGGGGGGDGYCGLDATK